jgi:hypothetical protein
MPAALPADYALAVFALMSAVISALWLRIPNPMHSGPAGGIV